MLPRPAKWIVGTSLIAFWLGFAWLFAAAPCSNVGVYILLSATLLALLGALLLFARAIAVRLVQAWVGFGAVLLLAGVEFCLTYSFSLLLCRGV